MYEEERSLSEELIGTSYAKQGFDGLKCDSKDVAQLLRHRKLPEIGWDELRIEAFINDLARMDTNNFQANVGVGEREGRVLCPLVSRRHLHLAHGVGRSGDVNAVQPKAAGSSLVVKLTNALILDAIRLAGIRSCRSCFVVPTATGMALMLCLLRMKQMRPHGKYVIWSRIDQKSCFKCILTAGLTPLVVNPILSGDELRTDTNKIQDLLTKHKHDVLCVITTNSCFAPRIPDDICAIAALCKTSDTFHLVNNAYGLQSSKCCHQIEQAIRQEGRIDVFVQSADKNFQVPVGGAIIAGFDDAFIDNIAKAYPGRGAIAPALDCLLTLLWQGSRGWVNALKERKTNFDYFRDEMSKTATTLGERLLNTKGNPISLAMSLDHLQHALAEGESGKSVTELGAALFFKCCSGARVVRNSDAKTIDGFLFEGWGAHCDAYPVPYLNVACAIGMTKDEIDTFIKRLVKCYTAIVTKHGSITKKIADVSICDKT